MGLAIAADTLAPGASWDAAVDVVTRAIPRVS